MKEAGVALQTFYRIFAGKDQLLLAVFEDLIAESCADYEEAAAELPDPGRAPALLRHRGRAVGRRRRRSDGIGPRFVTAEHWRLHQLFPEEMAHATQPFTDLVARQLELARRRGAAGVDRPAARRVVRHQARDGRVPPLRVRRRRARRPRDRRRPLGVLPPSARHGPDRTSDVPAFDTTDNGEPITMGGTEVRRTQRAGVRAVVGAGVVAAAGDGAVWPRCGGAAVPAADPGRHRQGDQARLHLPGDRRRRRRSRRTASRASRPASRRRTPRAACNGRKIDVRDHGRRVVGRGNLTAAQGPGRERATCSRW